MALKKPHPLKPGDKIAICSPSSPHASRINFTRAKKSLEKLGLKTEEGPTLWAKNGYLAGSDEERAREINELFDREDVNGIMAIKGGYGAERILKYLDWKTIQNNTKVFIGFSDITALHLAFYQKTNLVTFHGPVFSQLAPERITSYMLKGLEKAIMEEKPLGEIKPAPEEKSFTYTINPGQAEGPLVGGCLSLITRSLGTPFEIDTRDKILFIEEVGEEPYKMDGMLHQLYRADKLQQARGIVIGECSECKPRDHRPAFITGTFTLEEILLDIIGSLDIPAFYGLPLGHTRHIATIPYGVKARIDAEECRLSIEETATCEQE